VGTLPSAAGRVLERRAYARTGRGCCFASRPVRSRLLTRRRTGVSNGQPV